MDRTYEYELIEECFMTLLQKILNHHKYYGWVSHRFFDNRWTWKYI